MRVVWGSFLAVLVGWATGLIIWIGVFLFLGSWNWENFINIIWMAAATWIFILPVWLFVCLPLYAFVPRKSILWQPAVCTILGGVTGAAVLFPWWMLWVLPLAGMITGAAASLFASLTVDRFREEA